MGSLRVTKKQIALLAAIRKGGDSGNFPDIDQVLKNLSYETTKQSLQFSIRALIKNGWVVKGDLEVRRGQERRVVFLTHAGYLIVNKYSKSGADVE